MIPNIIHYCWFGGNPLPESVKSYMESWRSNFPDFHIKQWDETNFDVSSRLYTRQAYFARKYAFVSDVARLHALCTDGGLYLDTDILIKRPFPVEWFKMNAFGSFEHDKYVETGLIASVPGHPVIKQFLDIYNNIPFFNGWNYDFQTNVVRFTDLMKDKGFVMNNQLQHHSDFTLFPQEMLCGNDWRTGRYDTDETYAVHEYQGEWCRDALNARIKHYFNMYATILKWKLSKLGSR